MSWEPFVVPETKSFQSKQTSQPYNDGVMSKGHDARDKVPNGQSWKNYNNKEKDYWFIAQSIK